MPSRMDPLIDRDSRYLNVVIIAELCVNQTEAYTAESLGHIYIAIFRAIILVFGVSCCAVPPLNIAFPFWGYDRYPDYVCGSLASYAHHSVAAQLGKRRGTQKCENNVKKSHIATRSIQTAANTTQNTAH